MGTNLYHIRSLWFADESALATGSAEDTNHDLRIVNDFCEATCIRKTSRMKLLSASLPPGVEASVLTHLSQPEMTSKEY
jgi:hypothetical protein